MVSITTKKIGCIVLLLLPVIYAINYPTLTKYVTDQADIISQEDEQKINELAKQIEQETTAEVAIVTISSLEGISKEQYTLELFEKAGIGKKDKDNGLLILIAVEDREYRVEVGYGLEEFIPDSSKITIGTRILEPYFKEGEFGQGVYESLNVIKKLIQGQDDVISQYQSTPTTLKNKAVWIYLSIFILLIVISIINRRTRFYPIFIPGPHWNNGTGSFGTGGFGGGFSGGSSGGGGFGGRF